MDCGDNVGCQLRGIERGDVERGQVLAKPGSIKPLVKFRRRVRADEEEGGRHTTFSRVPTAVLHSVDGREGNCSSVGVEMVMPGQGRCRGADPAGGAGGGCAVCDPRGGTDVAPRIS